MDTNELAIVERVTRALVDFPHFTSNEALVAWLRDDPHRLATIMNLRRDIPALLGIIKTERRARHDLARLMEVAEERKEDT